MNQESPQGGRRGAISAAAAALLLVVAGTVVTSVGLLGSDTQPADSKVASVVPAKAGPSPSESPKQLQAQKRSRTVERPDFGPVLPGSPPVVLTIPAIGVRSDNIVDLELAADGTMEVPQDASAPGWFTPGPSPGQFGPAIIVGHVDSETGPAVFYRLGELRPGDRVKVSRQDGSVAIFGVDSVQTYEKNEFPTRDVYGNSTSRAELRLITCSGEYDSETGYLSNTVVFAHLLSR